MNEFYDPQMFRVASAEDDPIEALVRRGAKGMRHAALEQAVSEYVARGRHARREPASGRRGQRHDHAPERTITVGRATVKIKPPRGADVPAGQAPFESRIVKPYQRRAASLPQLLPKLFLEGLAPSEVEPALRCLLGAAAARSPATSWPLTSGFKAEYEDWTSSRLAALPIGQVWVDGIYSKLGIADARACLLVVGGADISGKKHLWALAAGQRASKESWLAVLRSLKGRGLNEPARAVGDGGLGGWAAAAERWRQTKPQRCWVHKRRKVLDKLPHKARAAAARSLRARYLSRTREETTAKLCALAKSWRGLYDRAAECLLAALDRMLTFFEFPGEHHKHIRTTNVIESVVASVSLRTDARKRLRAARSAVYLIYQMVKRAEKRLQRLSPAEKLRHSTLPSPINNQTVLAA